MRHAANFYFTSCLVKPLTMLFLHEMLYLEIGGNLLNWGSVINLAYQALSFLFLNPFLIAVNPRSVAVFCIFY